MPIIATIDKVQQKSRLANYRSTAIAIEKRAASMVKLDEDQLRKRSLALRFDAQSGTPLVRLLVEAFALVRESARRTTGMQHYRVQLIGGIAMFHRSIVVMQTGEGKTLTATLPLYLQALVGKGAHLATANDYLAARDAEIVRPIFGLLGMSVGVVTGEMESKQRRAAYDCDVTYTTAKEAGFDFLRDRLIHRQLASSGENLIPSMTGRVDENGPQPVQRDLHFMLVDEADNILIDEARTPLIVSSTPDRVAVAKIALYRWTAQVAPTFEKGTDYHEDESSHAITLTAAGRRRVRTSSHPANLSRTPVIDIYQQVEQAIYVNANYIRDRHYVVRDGEVTIVDEFTGRLAEGRKWRSGIHQAVEAREGLEISVETGEAARITIQDLFRKYDSLCGMTGTVASSGPELKSIYDVKVVAIPTNRPPRRVQQPTLVFGNEEQKWNAIADEVEAMHRLDRPVLVGTRSIDKSEVLSRILNERSIPHEVLNARHLDREADIVAGAGNVRRVTVATNMAGRGTDIKLSDASLLAGGLHVICSELHESARIDRQLIGRCGRQGDPGSFRQYLSLEDDLLLTGLGEKKATSLKLHQSHDSRALSRFARLFVKAQRRIERQHFSARKMLLHFDKQRQQQQREMGQDPYLDTAGS